MERHLKDLKYALSLNLSTPLVNRSNEVIVGNSSIPGNLGLEQRITGIEAVPIRSYALKVS